MPIFHLHLRNRDVAAPDEEGHDLPDLAAARAKALEGIRDYLGHEAMAGTLDLRGQIDIADSAGTVLDTIHFKDAVTIVYP